MRDSVQLAKDILKVVIICISAIVCIIIITNTFLDRNKENEIIDVTGLGEIDFEADLIVWSGHYTRVHKDLQAFLLWRTMNHLRAILLS